MSTYAELHCLSCFSFLRSALPPPRVGGARGRAGLCRAGHYRRVLTGGIVKAHMAAKEHGIQLIVGSEFQPGRGHKLAALAPSRAAYSELSGLISMARRRSPKGSTRPPCAMSFSTQALPVDLAARGQR